MRPHTATTVFDSCETSFGVVEHPSVHGSQTRGTTVTRISGFKDAKWPSYLGFLVRGNSGWKPYQRRYDVLVVVVCFFDVTLVLVSFSYISFTLVYIRAHRLV